MAKAQSSNLAYMSGRSSHSNLHSKIILEEGAGAEHSDNDNDKDDLSSLKMMSNVSKSADDSLVDSTYLK